MITKKCAWCGRELPATLEYFWKQTTHADGLKSRCIECHGGQFRIGGTSAKNGQRGVPDGMRRCAICGEIKPKTEEYFHVGERNNRGYTFMQWTSYCRPCASKKSKELIYANYDRYAQKRREWATKNREALNAYSRERRAHAVANGGKLAGDQWEEAKEFFGGCCAYCGKETKELTRDHFIPITKGGQWDATNIIPACKPCNSSKNNKDFAVWYPESGHYDEGREQRILYYLNVVSGAIKDTNYGFQTPAAT